MKTHHLFKGGQEPLTGVEPGKAFKKVFHWGAKSINDHADGGIEDVSEEIFDAHSSGVTWIRVRGLDR